MKTRAIGIALVVWLAALAAAWAGRPPSPFGLTADLATNDGRTIVRFNFTLPPEHQLNAAKLAFETADGTALTQFSAPAPIAHTDPESGTEKKVYEHSFTAELALQSPLPSGLVVKFQGCSNAACYFPERHAFTLGAEGIAAVTEPAETTTATAVASVADGGWQTGASQFKVVARETGYVARRDFIGFLEDAKSGRASTGGMLARFKEAGLLATLLLIVVGGLGLNLTPCVLPMIPINLAIIGAGAQASSRRRGFALGAIYGSGMALVYGGLGLVVVLTGAKFGTLNSSVVFNFVIAVIFVVMGLAMFDVVNVDFSRFQAMGGAGGKGQRGRFILAFSMGMVAALLAGACVAPVVISVLLLAAQLYNQGLIVALLLPFLLGLGMALPWPFAGAGLSFLPKPGKWMKRVKQGFGVFILLFALYYGHLAGSLFLNHQRLVVSARTRAAGGAPLAGQNDLLAAALQRGRQENRPVFIDFAASWCKNCLAMDSAVFSSADVKDKLKDFVVVRYEAEEPNESPAREVLDRFGVIGLPTYVVLQPDDKSSVTR